MVVFYISCKYTTTLYYYMPDLHASCVNVRVNDCLSVMLRIFSSES